MPDTLTLIREADAVCEDDDLDEAEEHRRALLRHIDALMAAVRALDFDTNGDRAAVLAILNGEPHDA